MKRIKSKKSCPKRLARLTLAVFLVLAAFLTYFLLAIHISPPKIDDYSAIRLERKTDGKDSYSIGKNWLRRSPSGLWEMYVEGDGFERGVINGKLTRELAAYQEKVFIDQIRELVPNASYLNFLKYFVAYFNRHLPEHITQEYQEEIYGVSLSASDEFDRLAPKYYRILNYHSAHDIGHALQDKNMTVGCTSFGVWNRKTADGKLLLGRNFDFFAGENFARNKIVCFTRPAQGHPFMYVTWAGFTGVVSGMNNKGLSVTINAAKSEIPGSAATPISLLAKEILQYAGNIQEAYAIAEKRKTFVSESILLGSAADHRSAIIEKTPSSTGLYSEKGDQLICANHFRGPLFENNYINNKNIIESSSLYRENRMEQLLENTTAFTPAKVAAVLRDQDGLNGKKIGLTNEKAINQLLAHHAVIFKPEELKVWVSASPFQLGEFVCYDLKKVFDLAPELRSETPLNETSLGIPADPFLTSEGYRNFLLFRQLRSYIEFCTKSKYDLRAEPRFLEAFVRSNPESYLSYWTLGNYYRKIGNPRQALEDYTLALTKEVPTQKEARQISEAIQAIKADGKE